MVLPTLLLSSSLVVSGLAIARGRCLLWLPEPVVGEQAEVAGVHASIAVEVFTKQNGCALPLGAEPREVFKVHRFIAIQIG